MPIREPVGGQEKDQWDDLELYPRVRPLRALRDGLRAVRENWKRIAAVTVVVLLVGGAAGYRWITTATPMDRSHAVELFRAERSKIAADASDQVHRDPSRKDDGRRAPSAGKSERRERRTTAPRVATRAAQPNSNSPPPKTSTSESGKSGYTLPEEGVYSWATDGYEQVGGARRQFPEETQRIFTVQDDRSWTQHHYFSEEREIWTGFHWGSRGVEVMQQRNKVTFGPVTNASKIDFTPPMLVAPRELRVGYEWGGKWTGDTYGDYSSKIFEHSTIVIGGERVEVWGMAYVINLHGEQEGRVSAQVWVAPEPGLTVKEHYVQDVKSSGAEYHAEWKQTLKSLRPRQ